eukprot:523453_1
MEQLVRFRMLSSALVLDEYRALLFAVLDEDNMSVFSSMIFNHCLKQLKTQNGSNRLQIHTIIQKVTDILSQREPNDSNQDDDTSDDESDAESRESSNTSVVQIRNHILDCADNLIQQIASYLPCKSYSNFQCCCRSIFYAANSPSSLYELTCNTYHMDLTKCFNSDSMHGKQLFMKRFERIQKLSISDNYEYIVMIRFKNLKHLKLTLQETHAEQYLSKKTFNFATITHLDIDIYSITYSEIDFSEYNYFFDIINRCKGLRTLIVNGINIDDDDARSLSLSQRFANLEPLSNLYGLEFEKAVCLDTRIVLKDICNTLQSLSIFNPHHKVDGLTFSNLVQLDLQYPTPNETIAIIKGTKRLKRLNVFDFFDEYDIETDTSYRLAFEKIFELRTLEYLYIRHDDNEYGISSLTDWIESASHKKRDVLKLEFDIHFWKPSTSNEIVRICNAVSSLNTHHFKLIFQYYRCAFCRDLTTLNEWLDTVSNVLFVDRKEEETLVISNREYVKSILTNSNTT